mmetsp:Transcript_4750/g.18179  ORF Transcript_4750/g.18179 Transcript_4750/m.18179 type:complete len:211 (+) Transcript_4750:1667-2299(+)
MTPRITSLIWLARSKYALNVSVNATSISTKTSPGNFRIAFAYAESNTPSSMDVVELLTRSPVTRLSITSTATCSIWRTSSDIADDHASSASQTKELPENNSAIKGGIVVSSTFPLLSPNWGASLKFAAGGFNPFAAATFDRCSSVFGETTALASLGRLAPATKSPIMTFRTLLTVRSMCSGSFLKHDNLASTLSSAKVFLISSAICSAPG